MARLEPMRALDQILDPKHAALLIVDMQNDFCSPKGLFAQAGRDVSSCKTIIPNIKRLLETARQKGIFRVQLRQISMLDNVSDNDAWLAFKTRDGKSSLYTLQGTFGCEIVDELRPLPGEPVVDKLRPNGFLNTFLDTILRANGIRSLAICGCTTEGCVMSTVLGASHNDYYTLVLEDAVASSVPKMNETALDFMRTRYKILQTKELLSIWSSD